MKAIHFDFQGIYDEFQPKVLRYLTRMLGENEAEDVTQEVFSKISQTLATFRGDSQLSTWIYRIATNAALDRIRSKSFPAANQKSLSIDPSSDNDTNEDTCDEASSTSADQQLIREEMNACIRNVMNRLPENYRTVVVLSEFEGLRDREIADILGLSLEATKIRIHRARTQLRKELAASCVFYRDERNEFACDVKNQPRNDLTTIGLKKP